MTRILNPWKLFILLYRNLSHQICHTSEKSFFDFNLCPTAAVWSPVNKCWKQTKLCRLFTNIYISYLFKNSPIFKLHFKNFISDSSSVSILVLSMSGGVPLPAGPSSDVPNPDNSETFFMVCVSSYHRCVQVNTKNVIKFLKQSFKHFVSASVLIQYVFLCKDESLRFVIEKNWQTCRADVETNYLLVLIVNAQRKKQKIMKSCLDGALLTVWWLILVVWNQLKVIHKTFLLIKLNIVFRRPTATQAHLYCSVLQIAYNGFKMRTSCITV